MVDAISAFAAACFLFSALILTFSAKCRGLHFRDLFIERGQAHHAELEYDCVSVIMEAGVVIFSYYVFIPQCSRSRRTCNARRSINESVEFT